MPQPDTVCGICAAEMDASYGRFSVPTECIPLYGGDVDVEQEAVSGFVTTNFCESCAKPIRQIVEGDENTPLPACDLGHAELIDSTHILTYPQVAAGRLGIDAGVVASVVPDGLADWMVNDAQERVADAREADHLPMVPPRLIEACVVLLSAHEVGLAPDPRPLPRPSPYKPHPPWEKDPTWRPSDVPTPER
jgi:hypothetical protein